MTDYAAKVSVRNNRILRALRDAGYKSQADFCNQTGFPYQVLSDLVRMRRKAFARHDQWSGTVITLALLLAKEPEDLFTPRQASALAVNCVEAEMTESQVAG